MNRRSLLKGLAAVTAGVTALVARPSVEAAARKGVVEPTCIHNEWCFNAGCLDPDSNVCHIRQDDKVGRRIVTMHPNFPAMPAIADFANASHTHDYFETPRYDASMSSWVKLIDFYDVNGELRTYRLTSTGISPA